MNEIIALQKYENEAQLAKELIRGFWLAHGDYVITDEEAAENRKPRLLPARRCPCLVPRRACSDEASIFQAS